MWGLILLMGAVGIVAMMITITVVLTVVLDCWHYVVPFKHYTPSYIYRRVHSD